MYKTHVAAGTFFPTDIKYIPGHLGVEAGTRLHKYGWQFPPRLSTLRAGTSSDSRPHGVHRTGVIPRSARVHLRASGTGQYTAPMGLGALTAASIDRPVRRAHRAAAAATSRRSAAQQACTAEGARSRSATRTTTAAERMCRVGNGDGGFAEHCAPRPLHGGRARWHGRHDHRLQGSTHESRSNE